MTKPITPSEARYPDRIPSKVFEAFNNQINKNFRGCSAAFKQSDVVDDICALMNVTREEVFSKGWLDIEPYYQNMGWIVIYDKPGYNESYEATFEFRSK